MNVCELSALDCRYCRLYAKLPCLRFKIDLGRWRLCFFGWRVIWPSTDSDDLLARVCRFKNATWIGSNYSDSCVQYVSMSSVLRSLGIHHVTADSRSSGLSRSEGTVAFDSSPEVWASAQQSVDKFGHLIFQIDANRIISYHILSHNCCHPITSISCHLIFHKLSESSSKSFSQLQALELSKASIPVAARSRLLPKPTQLCQANWRDPQRPRPPHLHYHRQLRPLKQSELENWNHASIIFSISYSISSWYLLIHAPSSSLGTGIWLGHCTILKKKSQQIDFVFGWTTRKAGFTPVISLIQGNVL